MNNSLVLGVGFNDAGYKVKLTEECGTKGRRKQRVVWVCPFYQTWRNMLTRCYSKSKNIAYNNCVVCGDWLTFSIFKGWMEKQSWEGAQLDKDLLIKGNLIYSPDTCVFLPKKVNLFLTENKNTKGNLPIGVDERITNKSNPYRASIHNPFTLKREHLGYFPTPEEAHLAWKSAKTSFIPAIVKEFGLSLVVEQALYKRYT